MNAKLHVICAAVAATLGLSGCAATATLVTVAACVLAFNPHPESIAGEYRLVSVNGQALPWRGPPDAAGRPVTIVSGTLTLGDAVPDFYDDAGGGIAIARSCMQQIPEDASVDGDGVVYNGDGTSYLLTDCGNGRYDLAIGHGYGYANEAASGRYTWGSAASGPPRSYITLVGSMNGEVIRSGSVLIRVQRGGWPDSPDEPLLEFSNAAR